MVIANGAAISRNKNVIVFFMQAFLLFMIIFILFYNFVFCTVGLHVMCYFGIVVPMQCSQTLQHSLAFCLIRLSFSFSHAGQWDASSWITSVGRASSPAPTVTPSWPTGLSLSQHALLEPQAGHSSSTRYTGRLHVGGCWVWRKARCRYPAAVVIIVP